MGEFLRSKSARRAATATLATFTLGSALAGCGGSGDSKTTDKGTNLIGQCPPHYIHRSDRPVRSLPEAEQSFGSAVVQLSEKLPIDNGGEPATHFSGGGTPKDQAIWNVANEVFRTTTGQYNTAIFAVGEPNKIDDLSEQFCRQGSIDYLSPQARNIVGGFQALGVNVGSLR